MSKRILIVDDERTVADTLTIILRRSGYDCRTAYDGIEAVAASGEFAPDLIISDMVMPRMGGMELLRQSMQMPNSPAVLLISGNAEAAGIYEREKVPHQRARFVTKPIPPPALLDIVSSMLQAKAA